MTMSREDLSRLEHRAGALDAAEPCARCGRPLAQPPPASSGPSGGALPRLYLFPTGELGVGGGGRVEDVGGWEWRWDLQGGGLPGVFY